MTPQDAIRALREHLGVSQEGLSRLLDVTVRTVARWEGEQSPKGRALSQLMGFAHKHGRKDIGEVFRRALIEEFGLIGPDLVNKALGPVMRSIVLAKAISNQGNRYQFNLAETRKLGEVLLASLREALGSLTDMDVQNHFQQAVDADGPRIFGDTVEMDFAMEQAFLLGESGMPMQGGKPMFPDLTFLSDRRRTRSDQE